MSAVGGAPITSYNSVEFRARKLSGNDGTLLVLDLGDVREGDKAIIPIQAKSLEGKKAMSGFLKKNNPLKLRCYCPY